MSDSPVMTDSDSAIGATRLPVSSLLLDVDNPRLAEYGVTKSATPNDLVKVLWEKMAVAEVAMSIAYSGYFEHEPLFVEKSVDHLGKFVVIEGNRRLAAIQLLLDPELRKRIKATDLPTIDAASRQALSTVPAVITTRKSLWRYLGFKHVNGPSTWGSYAKAQYIAHVHNTYHVPLKDIAAQIGDYNSTVERMYRGLMIVEQAEEADVFNRQDVAKTKFAFNYIYTGMDYPGISHFIGLKKTDSATQRPVPRTKIKQLGELLGWLYGRESTGKPSLIKSQNPDLKVLDGILLSDEGVQALRDNLPLSVAKDISLGDEKLFRQSLQAAKLSLQKALGTLTTGYDSADTESTRLANELEILTHDLVDGMRKKVRERQNLVRKA